jgi:hypothetical protein
VNDSPRTICCRTFTRESSTASRSTSLHRGPVRSRGFSRVSRKWAAITHLALLPGRLAASSNSTHICTWRRLLCFSARASGHLAEKTRGFLHHGFSNVSRKWAAITHLALLPGRLAASSNSTQICTWRQSLCLRREYQNPECLRPESSSPDCPVILKKKRGLVVEALSLRASATCQESRPASATGNVLLKEK